MKLYDGNINQAKNVSVQIKMTPSPKTGSSHDFPLFAVQPLQPQ